MLTLSERQCIDRRCAAVLARVVNSLPKLLADPDSLGAAAIVADLIKFQLSIKEEEADPGAALAEVIRQVNEADKHRDPANCP